MQDTLGKLELTAILLCSLPAFGADGLLGRVVEDATGSPVESAAVRVFREGQGNDPVELRTDRDGRFQAAALSPGAYRLEISKPDFVNVEARLTLAAGGIPLTIHLPRDGSVTGQALDSQGQPMTAARVTAFAIRPDGLRRSLAESLVFPAVPNERGEYRLKGLPPGQYELAVTYRTGGMAFPQRFVVIGGEEFHADFRETTGGTYSVTGRVLLPGPRTRMVAALDPLDHPAVAVAIATPDAYGKLQFPHVATGTYDLLISGPPVGSGSNGADIEEELYYSRTRLDVPGQNVEGVLVEVPRGRNGQFQLVPAPGCPTTARLTLSPLDDWGTNVERTFEISAARPTAVEDLAPTRFAVAVSAAGVCFGPPAMTADFTNAGAAAPISVPITTPGALHGRITGTITPGEVAVVLLAQGEPRLRVVFPAVDGKFDFNGLRPGPYQLAAQPAGDAASRWVTPFDKMFEVEVTGGTSLELDLPSPRRGVQ